MPSRLKHVAPPSADPEGGTGGPDPPPPPPGKSQVIWVSIGNKLGLARLIEISVNPSIYN